MTDLRMLAARVAHHGPPRTGWADDAACADAPKDAFFAAKGGTYDRAAALCESCPVALDCLAEALPYAYNEDYGYRAGTTPRTRVQLRVMVREFSRRVAS